MDHTADLGERSRPPTTSRCGRSSGWPGDNDGTIQVSTRVWAIFPHNAAGRAAEWIFTRLINGIAKDREHARTEPRYLKHIIERNTHHPAG